MINLRKKINLKKEDLVIRNKGVEELRIKYGVEKVENELKEFIINGINVGLFKEELKVNEDCLNCFLDSIEIDDSYLKNMNVLYYNYIVWCLFEYEEVYKNYDYVLNCCMGSMLEVIRKNDSVSKDLLYSKLREYCRSISLERLVEDLKELKNYKVS